MKDLFFIQIDDNGISLSSNMLTWIDPINAFSLLGYFAPDDEKQAKSSYYFRIHSQSNLILHRASKSC